MQNIAPVTAIIRLIILPVVWAALSLVSVSIIVFIVCGCLPPLAFVIQIYLLTRSVVASVVSSNQFLIGVSR